MKKYGSSQFHEQCDVYGIQDRSGVYFEIAVFTSGNKVILELHERSEAYGNPILRSASIPVGLEKPPKAAQAHIKDLAAVIALAESKYTRNRETGLFLPALERGETMILDRPGADRVKVLEQGQAAPEEIPKASLVKAGERLCTCPWRTVYLRGCQCGGA